MKCHLANRGQYLTRTYRISLPKLHCNRWNLVTIFFLELRWLSRSKAANSFSVSISNLDNLKSKSSLSCHQRLHWSSYKYIFVAYPLERYFFRFALLSSVETILMPYILPLTTLRDGLLHVVWGTFSFEQIIRYLDWNRTECACPIQLKFLKFHCEDSHNMRKHYAQNGLDFHFFSM